MNRGELQTLSKMRLREARSLFDNQHFSGSYYLAGYAVECALKACIARLTVRHEFPDRDRVTRSYSHKPAELLKVAGLSDALLGSAKRDLSLSASWSIVVNWSEQSRYSVWDQREAEAMLKAVGGTRTGVFRWITQHW